MLRQICFCQNKWNKRNENQTHKTIYCCRFAAQKQPHCATFINSILTLIGFYVKELNLASIINDETVLVVYTLYKSRRICCPTTVYIINSCVVWQTHKNSFSALLLTAECIIHYICYWLQIITNRGEYLLLIIPIFPSCLCKH